MRTTLVLTVLGNDRPGIVEQLSDCVLEAGANWEESRMAHLSGKFAGLLRVSVDAGGVHPHPTFPLESEGIRAVLHGYVPLTFQPRWHATRTIRARRAVRRRSQAERPSSLAIL